MPKLTLESCKAPTHDEFPKLAKINALGLIDEARMIKREIAAMQERLKVIAPRIEAKLSVALGDDVKSVRYEDLLITRRVTYTKRTLDTKWAVKKLVSRGVLKEEIDQHTKETEVEGSVSMQLLGSETDSMGVDDGGDE